MITFTKQYTFSATHRLPEHAGRNCGTTHGHLYKLRLTFRAEVDKDTGLCLSRDRLDSVVQEHVLTVLSGDLLNKHFVFASGEFLTQSIRERLTPHFTKCALVRVSIQETRKNWFSSDGLQ